MFSSPSNPSTPARCYLHVMRTEDISMLAEFVQRSIWEDEKRSFNDPALVGPPCLDNSIYQKIPTTKRRVDSKQGTIDQDPDFMAFLDGLTQDPAAKDVDTDQVADDAAKVDIKVTTTPLVEYLKEKKANKGKETLNTKGGKHSRHESQGGKTKGGQDDSKKKGKETKADKADKASDKVKEPVKLLTKKSVAQEDAMGTKSTAAQSTSTKTAGEAVPKSRRANIAAAAKILQRDLGLSPGSAHRRARQDAAKAEAAAKTDTSKEKDGKDSASAAPTVPPSQSASSAPPSAPTAPKAQAEGSRRSRGTKAAKQNDTTKGKGTDNGSNTIKPTPMTATPVILKRKDDATPTGPTSTASVTASSSTANPPTGPKATASKAPSSNKPGPSQKKGSAQPSVTPGVVRAFVKHANPSQGITESLLKQTMESYGTVTFVEIDKRKGFAYVDFSDHDSLVKAVAASPVSIAQGSVQVLERKEIKKPTQAPAQPAAEKASTDAPPDRPKRGGRGRGRRGGGGANASATTEASGSTAPASSAPAEASAPANAG